MEPQQARVSMLIVGDMLAVYAGPERVGSATIEQPIGRDEYTPLGWVTLWTTGGRFDVPDDASLDVLAWAPGTTGR